MPATLIATWKYAMPAVEALFPLLHAQTIGAEDAAMRTCMHVEDEPNDFSVGYGGLPNALGEVELDAAMMEGRHLRMGAVGALKGFTNPVCAARLVMDTPYTLLTGQGAESFARQHGLKEGNMLSESAREKWLAHQKSPGHLPGHDTVCAIALEQGGHLAVATSTSGLAFKLPGRISDSAMPGCGFFADDEIGAAAATGCGEDIMRGGLSMRIMEMMRSGLSPQAAASRAVADLILRAPDIQDVAVIALSKEGDFGAAANHGNFVVAYGGPEGILLRAIPAVG